jgi:hypothetical protein
MVSFGNGPLNESTIEGIKSYSEGAIPLHTSPSGFGADAADLGVVNASNTCNVQ